MQSGEQLPLAKVMARRSVGLVVALILAPGGPGFAAAPIRLATHDQAPYGSYLADKSFDGVAVRVMRCVLDRMKQSYAIEVYPWERAQVLAERGDVSGFFPATLKAERLRWADATAVIADQKWVWYLPADSKLDPNAASFKSQATVGAHFGSNRLKMLESGGYNVVLRPQTDAALLQAFMRGNRADAILGGDLAIAEAMKDQNVDPQSLRTVVAADQPLHAYFGHKFLESHPGFIKQFNSYIDRCR